MENKLYSMRNGFKKARRNKGLSQQEVADKMGVILKTVMNWEQGISNPDLETAMKLADLFECDLDYLTGRIEEKTHDIKTVCEITGLSQEAVDKIIKIKTFEDQLLVKSLSHLIEQKGFGDLLTKYAVFYSNLKVYVHLRNSKIEHATEARFNFEDNSYTLPIVGFVEYCRQSVVETMTFICRDDPIIHSKNE